MVWSLAVLLQMNMVVRLTVFQENFNWLRDNNVAAWVSDDGNHQLTFQLASVAFGCGILVVAKPFIIIFIISFESE